MFRLGSHLTIALLFAVAAYADLPCEDAHQRALTVIETSRLSRDTERQILEPIASAWDLYRSGGSASRAAALVTSALRISQSSSIGIITPEFRNDIGEVLMVLSSCMPDYPVPKGPVAIRVFVADGARGKRAAGGGVTIRMDGIEITTTSENGQVTASVPRGTHAFTAEAAPDLMGSTRGNVYDLPVEPLEIVMKPGADLAQKAVVTAAEMRDGVLPRDAAAVTLHFTSRDGGPVAITRVGRVTLQSVDVTKLFEPLAGGDVRVRDVRAFRKLLDAQIDVPRIELHGFDGSGHAWRGGIDVPLAGFRVLVRIAPGDGDSATVLSNVPVRITSERTHLSFWAMTNARGVAEFPLVPGGGYDAGFKMNAGSHWYFGRGSFDVEQDGRVVDIAVTSRPPMGTKDVPPDAGWFDDLGHIHTAGDSPDPWPRLWISFSIGKDGAVRPINASTADVERPMVNVTEDALREALEHARVTTREDVRHVAVRVYDAGGHIVHRSLATVYFSREYEGTVSPVKTPWFEVEISGRIELEVADERIARGTSFDVAKVLAAEPRSWGGARLPVTRHDAPQRPALHRLDRNQVRPQRRR